MALPNDSSPTSSGEQLATHTVAGKEYQVFIEAGPSGHLRDSLDTFFVWTGPQAFAANKHFLSLLNASGSGRIVKVRKLFLINLQLAAISGVSVQFDVRRASAHSGGTLLTPETFDTANAALPAQITARAGATVTTGGLLFSHATNNDEVGLTNAFPTPQIQAMMNLMMEHPSMQDLVLREGQGFTVQNVTSTTVGSYGVLAGITVE